VRSFRTHSFKALFHDVPKNVQNLAIKAYKLWKNDPRHPSLHFKPINHKIWSIRINKNYRALGIKKTNGLYWFWIGTHDEYDKLI
jgi:plasmid maintenance system killer protein